MGGLAGDIAGRDSDSRGGAFAEQRGTGPFDRECRGTAAGGNDGEDAEGAVYGGDFFAGAEGELMIADPGLIIFIFGAGGRWLRLVILLKSGGNGSFSNQQS
jgi:hypothetical protein